MASLFGKNKLREIASKLQTSDLEDKIAIVKTWHHDYHNGSLKQDKETSREQAYNQDFFIKILGYKEKPAVPFSFEPKATTDKGQLPDAVLGHTDTTKDLKNIAAVVELKGAAIELDRPQRRDGNMSPVQQGFKYKTQYRNCPFVVVSNFWELRLYHDNQLDYELWTLDDLVDPDEDYLKFKTFYTLLHSDNLTTPKGSSKTEGWLSDIRFEQEEIGKKFYKVYREARLELLRDIYRQNESVRNDIDMGIEKSQKIIDRIVFACFAEDRGLLPDDTIRRVIDDSDKSSFGSSLWNTFKGFFEAIDVGDEKLEIPDGYNGGLFAHDAVLNSLRIADDPLRKVVKLSDYNFVEDLSVTILGHIFEQSISDLEEIKSKVQESQNLESLQQSRRKKDGIFYTPDYIVRYIVDNSLGAYLREAEEKLKEEFKLKGDITDKTYEKREKQAYSKYQQFLHEVKVVDPACGSGAFLVYVFDYLMAENQRVANILGNNLFSGDDYIKSILKNNIYGVDLNDESVEITKLSLWLKSAQKGKKLTTLDGNIKCGNSLISDASVAGSKSFDWSKEFPEIFASGGFDVVVGNPPYGAKMDNEVMKYFVESYKTTKYKLESYSLFTELGIDLLKPNGYLSYIMPYTWLTIQQHSKLRELVLRNNLLRILDLPTKVFADADLDTVIFVLSKSNLGKQLVVEKMNKLGDVNTILVDTENIVNDPNLSININASSADTAIVKKIQLSSKLGDQFNVSQGYIPYRRSDLVAIYGPEEGNAIVDERKWHSHSELNNEYKREITGRDIGRYQINMQSSVYIRYGKHVASYVDEKFFTSPRVLIMEVTRGDRYKLSCVYTEDAYYNSPSIINVISPTNDTNSLLSLLAVLNSSTLSWYHSKVNPKANAKTSIPKILIGDVRELPVCDLGDSRFAELSKRSIESRKELLDVSRRFSKLIQSELKLSDITLRQSWWESDFIVFIKNLKAKITLQQKDSLIQLFDKYCSLAKDLAHDANLIDNRIDQLVYESFGLSADEISVIENR